MLSASCMLKLIDGKRPLLAIVLGLLAVGVQSAEAQTETVLYSFGSQVGDGSNPYAGLTLDTKGNLFGTTFQGGANGYFYGTIFEVTAARAEKVLHSFGNPGGDGQYPVAGLTLDTKGNLYGTTSGGGSGRYDLGVGTVFEVTAAGAEKVLYSFGSQPGDGDGSTPQGGLILDSKGNLYGTTLRGGAYGGGTVFEVTAAGAEKVLYSFYSQPGDGFGPYAGLALDINGNLYGTTFYGGAYGSGTVFEVTAAGTEKVLYSFGSSAGDGNTPSASVIFDTKGDLYGTTRYGGAYKGGTVFELTAAGAEKVLHSFGSQAGDGNTPVAALILDRKGNLYGTTWQGGAYNQGTVFELTAAGEEKVLYSFGSQSGDGLVPGAGLTFDKMGNLYGTTYYGGAYGNGTVFLVTLPNFTIRASPTSATVSAGQSTSSTLKLSSVGGFSGTVKLSCGFPTGKGLSCGVSPSSVTLSGPPATANLSIGTASGTPAGVYKIKAKGVSGTLSNTTTFTLTVN